MRGFFGDLLCECESVALTEYALTTPDSVLEVTELLVICFDCQAIFYEASDVQTRSAAGLPKRPCARPGSYSDRGIPADDGATMATAKKTAAKTATKPSRGRNQERALVASMEDYEVKYLAQKDSLTQKAVKAAVDKVGNSRTKVERELKAGKA